MVLSRRNKHSRVGAAQGMKGSAANDAGVACSSFACFMLNACENTRESDVSAMWEHGGPVDMHKCISHVKLA